MREQTRESMVPQYGVVAVEYQKTTAGHSGDYSDDADDDGGGGKRC
jgi:hypothetical protein